MTIKLVLLCLFVLTVSLLADTRHSSTARKFRVLTGYPNGRAGWVVDHRIPLCAGGPDTVDNLQWEELRASYAKDTFERALCVELTRQDYVLVRAHPSP